MNLAYCSQQWCKGCLSASEFWCLVKTYSNLCCSCRLFDSESGFPPERLNLLNEILKKKIVIFLYLKNDLSERSRAFDVIETTLCQDPVVTLSEMRSDKFSLSGNEKLLKKSMRVATNLFIFRWNWLPIKLKVMVYVIMKKARILVRR